MDIYAIIVAYEQQVKELKNNIQDLLKIQEEDKKINQEINKKLEAAKLTFVLLSNVMDLYALEKILYLLNNTAKVYIVPEEDSGKKYIEEEQQLVSLAKESMKIPSFALPAGFKDARNLRTALQTPTTHQTN